LPRFGRLLQGVHPGSQLPVGRLLGCRLGFVLLIGIFYKGWEGASPAGIYPFGVLSLCVPFCLAVGLTADAAAWEASGHFDGSGVEVNLRIVLVQPGESEYYALLVKADDCDDESLIELAMYFCNWHMFRKYMNNIAC